MKISLNFPKSTLQILALLILAATVYILIKGNGRELLTKVGINLGTCTKADQNYLEGDYFCSNELGIKIKLSDEIKKQGLIFRHLGSGSSLLGVNASYTQVAFSTTDLTSLDSRCGVDKTPALGWITRVNDTGFKEDSTIKKFSSFTIIVENQATCTTSGKDVESYRNWGSLVIQKAELIK